jgi:hypothetical protein
VNRVIDLFVFKLCLIIRICNEETNTSGRVDNKGMEGLAITPDGTTLVGIVQAPTLQDTKKSGDLRIVTIDIALELLMNTPVI